MKLFLIDADYNVVPNHEEIMVIPQFKALTLKKYNQVENDANGRNRYRLKMELTFLYMYCDYGSPYSEYEESMKLEEALVASGFKKDYKISKELQAAIDQYHEFQNSREMRMLTGAYKAMDKLTTYMNTVEVNDDNAKAVIDNISKLGPLVQNMKKLETEVKKQESISGKIRGGQKKGFLDGDEFN